MMKWYVQNVVPNDLATRKWRLVGCLVVESCGFVVEDKSERGLQVSMSEREEEEERQAAGAGDD